MQVGLTVVGDMSKEGDDWHVMVMVIERKRKGAGEYSGKKSGAGTRYKFGTKVRAGPSVLHLQSCSPAPSSSP